MRFAKYLVLALALFSLGAANEASAKRKLMPKVYIYGFSAAFNDSTVYFTDVQEVENVWIDKKTKFLLNRQFYSSQLKAHLASKQNLPDRTCIVMYGLTRKDAEKKYIKLKKQYTVKAKNKFNVQYINSGEFKFKAVEVPEEVEE